MLPADQAWMRGAQQAAIVPSTAREGVRRKRHEYTIFEKRQVVRFALSLPRSASKLRLVGLQFPHMPGIAENGQVGKWTRRHRDFRWEHVPDELAKHCFDLPNWYKVSQGLGDGKKSSLKGRPVDWTMPEEIRQELEKLVAIRAMGASEATAVSENVSNEALVTTMKRIKLSYNTKAEIVQAISRQVRFVCVQVPRAKSTWLLVSFRERKAWQRMAKLANERSDFMTSNGNMCRTT